MAKKVIISISAILVDMIKKEEFATEIYPHKEIWEEMKELIKNGKYEGELSALMNEKYEKQRMKIKK